MNMLQKYQERTKNAQKVRHDRIYCAIEEMMLHASDAGLWEVSVPRTIDLQDEDGEPRIEMLADDIKYVSAKLKAEGINVTEFFGDKKFSMDISWKIKA